MTKPVLFLGLLCLFLYFYPRLSLSAGRGFLVPLGEKISTSLGGWAAKDRPLGVGKPVRRQVEPFKVPLLLYHFVENVADERDTLRRAMAVTPFLFEDQLKVLRESGYRAISFADLAAAYRGEIALPEKPIIITLDDGHRDLYFNALPLLVKYDFKATIFVITGKLGQPDFLTAAQLGEMAKSGYIEIGSHTISHEYLGVISTWAREEIFGSKEFLEGRFGVEVDAFSYPGGSKNEAVESLVKAAGYRLAAGTVAGVATEKSDPFDLPRLRVGNLSGKELLELIERYK